MKTGVGHLKKAPFQMSASMAGEAGGTRQSAEIVIASRQPAKKINTRLLKQIIAALLAELEVEGAELGVELVCAREMARVNWKYLQHEGSTDVITFDHLEVADSFHGKERLLHGELYICVDDAVKQADEFNTTWQSELVRYVVHGVLHLLGYDDLKADLRRVMKREEDRLVRWVERRFELAQLARLRIIRPHATMQFPITFNRKTSLPGKECDCCHAKSAEPEFFSLAVGVTQDYAASRVVDLSRTFVVFQLDWQGRKDTEGCGFSVVDDTADGQSIFSFCSTDCMRRFLNACVDHLDRLVQTTKKQ